MWDGPLHWYLNYVYDSGVEQCNLQCINTSPPLEIFSHQNVSLQTDALSSVLFDCRYQAGNQSLDAFVLLIRPSYCYVVRRRREQEEIEITFVLTAERGREVFL